MANEDPLNAFLNNMAGGQTPDDEPQNADMLGGLLQSLAGGGQDAGSGDNPLGGLLAGLLGGSPDLGPSASAGGMGNLLGSLFSGMSGQSMDVQGSAGGGLGDLLGMALGGDAGGGMAQAGALAPLADSIAAKAGIPREMALMGLMFLLTKLSAGQQGRTAGRSLSLDSLNTDPGGLASEFAAEAGVDEQTAEKTLTRTSRNQTGEC